MVEVRKTSLEGVVELVPARHGDDRGWFSEVWSARVWQQIGLDGWLDWAQHNESVSTRVGTLRGLHFQAAPHAQAKLVRVVGGRIRDVVIDLRRSSSTFGQHEAVELSAEVGNQLLVPVGFGHGFVTLEPNSHVLYKVSKPYEPSVDRCVQALDPVLGIDWGFDENELLRSDRDTDAPTLSVAHDLLFD